MKRDELGVGILTELLKFVLSLGGMVLGSLRSWNTKNGSRQ